MIKKTDMAVGAYESGNVKEALKIAKDFKIGVTREEHKQIVRAYECLVHREFYKQLKQDIGKEIAEGINIFLKKIYEPYKQRSLKEGELA